MFAISERMIRTEGPTASLSGVPNTSRPKRFRLFCINWGNKSCFSMVRKNTFKRSVPLATSAMNLKRKIKILHTRNIVLVRLWWSNLPSLVIIIGITLTPQIFMHLGYILKHLGHFVMRTNVGGTRNHLENCRDRCRISFQIKPPWHILLSLHISAFFIFVQTTFYPFILTHHHHGPYCNNVFNPLQSKLPHTAFGNGPIMLQGCTT